MKVCIFTLICASCDDLVTVYHNELLKGLRRKINITNRLYVYYRVEYTEYSSPVLR